MLPDSDTHLKNLQEHYRKIGSDLISDKLTLDQFVAECIENHLKLEKLADYDGLLPDFLNHQGFERAINRELSILRRRGDIKSVLLALDIDKLKQFNDTQGHLAGDKLIKIYSQVMWEQTRSADLKARLGGDEFAIFLIGTSLEDAKKIAEKIRTSIIETAKKEFPTLPWEQTISIGLTETTSEDNATDLRERADKALYKAKKDRNSVVTL